MTNGIASITGAPSRHTTSQARKTLFHWLSIATHDGDDQTRLTVLSPCVASAETDQQWDNLLVLFKQIVRAREACYDIASLKPISRSKPKDAYLNIVGYALHTLPPN